MIQYRADIDGLRALAVVLVVLFHAGLPWITGGFIGVDIFFVISGYLITSIILSDVRKGNFSYLTFYERRARRILPAFYFVATISLLAAIIMFTPNDLIKASKSLLAALFFSGNIFFWRTTNYFSDDSDFEPFLHTWSLAVEEQFYFLFPLLLLLFAKRNRLLFIVCIIGTVFSLALSEYATKHYTWAGYYLLPSRAWQLLAGALLAVYPTRLIGNKTLESSLAFIAMLLIFIPAFMLNKNTPFPGLAALPPTLGACLLIYLGRNTSLFTSKLLSLKPVVVVGLISYSLYLWHWPIFAFIRYYTASVELNLLASFAGILASFLAAYLSWRFIENPFRNKSVFSRRAIFSYSFIYGLILAGISSSLVLMNGLPQRLDERVIRYSSLNGGDILVDSCINKSLTQIATGDICQYDLHKTKTGKNILLWGDSHAAAFKPGFQVFLNDLGVKGEFIGGVGCPPLPGLLKLGAATGQPCLDSNSAILDYIRGNSEITTIVLHARWALSIDGSRFGVEKGPDYKLTDTLSKENGTNYSHVYRALDRLVKELNQLGKEIIIIGPIPEMGYNIPRLTANNIQWSKNREVRVTRAIFDERQAPVFDLLGKLQEENHGLRLFFPHETLCTDEYCEILEDDDLLYLDDDHLSTEGALKIGESLVHWYREDQAKSRR